MDGGEGDNEFWEDHIDEIIQSLFDSMKQGRTSELNSGVDQREVAVHALQAICEHRAYQLAFSLNEIIEGIVDIFDRSKKVSSKNDLTTQLPDKMNPVLKSLGKHQD